MLRKTLATAGVATLALVGGLALAGTANASTITNTNSGEAGYLLANDGHTHYRFISTRVEAGPNLATLNDTGNSDDGAEGVELCDPNTGFAAQVGLFWNGTSYEAAYAYGVLPQPTENPYDPCAQSGLLADLPGGTASPGAEDVTFGTLPVAIATGQTAQVSVYYDPKGHSHQLQFTVLNVTTGWVRNPTFHIAGQEFWEAGAGAFTPNVQTNAFSAINPLTFTNTIANFYSSTKGAFPLADAKAYYGYGGVTPVTLTNGAVNLSPSGLTNPSGLASEFTLSE
jgi:hypothetical protein